MPPTKRNRDSLEGKSAKEAMMDVFLDNDATSRDHAAAEFGSYDNVERIEMGLGVDSNILNTMAKGWRRYPDKQYVGGEIAAQIGPIYLHKPAREAALKKLQGKLPSVADTASASDTKAYCKEVLRKVETVLSGIEAETEKKASGADDQASIGLQFQLALICFSLIRNFELDQSLDFIQTVVLGDGNNALLEILIKAAKVPLDLLLAQGWVKEVVHPLVTEYVLTDSGSTSSPALTFGISGRSVIVLCQVLQRALQNFESARLDDELSPEEQMINEAVRPLVEAASLAAHKQFGTDDLVEIEFGSVDNPKDVARELEKTDVADETRKALLARLFGDLCFIFADSEFPDHLDSMEEELPMDPEIEDRANEMVRAIRQSESAKLGALENVSSFLDALAVFYLATRDRSWLEAATEPLPAQGLYHIGTCLREAVDPKAEVWITRLDGEGTTSYRPTSACVNQASEKLGISAESCCHLAKFLDSLLKSLSVSFASSCKKLDTVAGTINNEEDVGQDEE